MKKLLLLFVLLGLMNSCKSYKSCPTYASYYKYEYHDIGSDSIKIEYSPMLEYIPGDIFTLYPEGRDIEILSVERNGTKLILPKKSL